MAQKPVNTSSAKGASFEGELTKDTKRFLKENNQWTYARNAVNNTMVGDVGDLSNESSNYLCTAVIDPRTQQPLTIIGTIHVDADEWVIFSTDNVISEIGLFKESECRYTRIVNDPCLNFSTEHLIYGIGRTAYNCGRRVYWDDGFNPTRTLDIDNVPWVENCIDDGNGCLICATTDQLDCDKLRLAPLVRDLAFRIEIGNSSGQLLNGSYYVVGAYLIEGQRVTDYSLPSNIQGVFTHDNMASALDIYVDEADPAFDEFELVIIQFANFNTVARKVGVYSTRQKKITLDHIDERWPTIDPGLLLIQNPIPDKSDAVFRAGEYMIRVGPTSKFDFNYQPLANQIKIQWVAVEYPSDYYRKGGTNTGYMRDEVYPYFIRWVYNTGDRSKSYHIPGRIANLNELTPAVGDDVLPSDDPIRWKVYNTATVDPNFFFNNPGLTTPLSDGGVVLGGGDMAYWESTEKYDDKHPEIWNASSNPIWGSNDPAHDLCGRYIRHHKFPDNNTDTITGNMITNHYDPNNGENIRVMGIVVSNIKPPLDNDGNPITNIVGYEILRGSREGNKTVLAKGMLNNLREYKPVGQYNNRTFLYPNYPYNPTATDPNYQGLCVDHFLSSHTTQYDGSGGNGLSVNNYNAYLNTDYPLGAPGVQDNGVAVNWPEGDNIKRDLVTFHSPETNFRNPFLSAKEIKVYGELHGTMVGQFQLPKDHPRHKFITDTAFVVAALVGIGYALLSTEGEKSTTYRAPQIQMGGTKTDLGTVVGTTGLFGGSAIAAATQLVGTGLSSLADILINELLSHSMLSTVMSITGMNPNGIRDAALQTSGFLSGAIGGQGGEMTYNTKATGWSATPGSLRFITGIPAFLMYWAEGVDKIIDLIYAFTPYRHYALQQISHCYYDRFAGSEIGDMRREIQFQSYLGPSFQDFAQNYRINNLFRSRTVALKLHSNLRLPHQLIDNSQAIYSDVWGRSDIDLWNNEETIGNSFTRDASSHYVALKQRLDNQYGQLAGIMQVPVSTNYTDKAQDKTGVLFNGDIYIGRYTEKNTMFFFYDWLKGQPDGAEFNYKLRQMVPHPRFWMNTDPFDSGEFVSSLVDILTGGNGAPGGFDPFMVENPQLYVIPGDADSGIVPCDCNDLTTNCYFSQSDLQEICDLEEELYQAQLWKEYLEECACYINVSSSIEPGCNEDSTELNPQPGDPLNSALENPALAYDATTNPYEFEDCDDCWTTACSSIGTETQAGKFLEKDKGKWHRKVKKAEKRVKKVQKKLNKKKDKLYEEYLDDLDGNNDTGSDLVDALALPSDKFAFDMVHEPSIISFNIKRAWMYLFNSGIRDFYVESEINLDYRDWGEKTSERHYDHMNYTDLTELFSTDHIKVGNYMKYDYSLSVSKIFNNYVSWGSMQDRDYNPEIAETCFLYRPKRLMYSLPQSLENKKDNWRVFLPLNYKDFNSVVTTIKTIGKNGALMLFENESPVQVLGVDTLETDAGTKLTIGDGGLFNQPLQNLVNTDYPHEYGSCQDSFSVVNTPAGLYYMSQNQGKIFQVTGEGLREISAGDLKWWFARYLPYQLTKHPQAFLDPVTGHQKPFDLIDNPVIGIGCQAIYDNKNAIVYFCKKDWVIREDIADIVTYVSADDFLVNGILPVKLGDPNYFRSASWTVSWDPKAQGGAGSWLSWHDWYPDLVIPTKNTYMTTKNNGIWVHADRCDSFCNFYGTDYPFELEFTLQTTGEVNTLRNILYFMEVYIYGDNCHDRFHDLDFNFDQAIISNSEQCSGLLRLNLKPKNNAPEIVTYPRVNFDSIDVLYSKEEQKYRFNQFWDITADRGEFNNIAHRPIWQTEPNGYVRNLNQANLNYNKFALERKKFRHYMHSVWLCRRVSGNRNMVMSMGIQMNLNSPR